MQELDSIDRRWLWYYHSLQQARQRLLRLQREQHVEASALIETDPIDQAERANEQTDFEILLSEVNVADHELAEIDAALDRIRNGTYGICERTGRSIPWERLRAIPWTRYCVEAADGNESA